MSQKPADRDDRLEQQYRRLGTREPMCVICSESNPLCLEMHHVAGQKHHSDLAIVCRNCHRKLTDQQHDHVRTPAYTTGAKLDTIGRYLLGIADLLAMIVATIRQFGEWLIEQARKPNVA
jgi:hypothetical protein